MLRSVLVSALTGPLLSCSAPAKDQRTAPATASSPASSSDAGSTQPKAPPSAAPAFEPATAASNSPAPASPTSSAYPGCGEPIPPERLWDETTEGEVLDAIGKAKACAADNGRHVLLEFVAPWCDDCREMARLDETGVVTAALKARFERVRINIGRWDRHEGLRRSFDVRALATYVVLDPKTSRQLAKTTLEPISKKGKKLTAEEWARWLTQH